MGKDIDTLQCELNNLNTSITFTAKTLKHLKKKKKDLLATLLSTRGVSNILRQQYNLGVYPQHVYAWAQVSDEPCIRTGRRYYFNPDYAHRLAATDKAKAHYSEHQVSLNKIRKLREIEAEQKK